MARWLASLTCLAALPLTRGEVSLFDPKTGAPLGSLDMPPMPKPDWGHIPVTRPLMCQACFAAMTEAHRVVGKAWEGFSHTTGDVGKAKRAFGSRINLGTKEAQLIEEIEKNFCYPGNFRAYTVFPPELEAACKAFMDEWNDDSTVEATLADTELPVAAARDAACGPVCEPVPADERMPAIPEPPEGLERAPGPAHAPPPPREGPAFTPPWLRDESDPMFKAPKPGATAAPFIKKTARKATAEEILELRAAKKAAKAAEAAKKAVESARAAASPAAEGGEEL